LLKRVTLSLLLAATPLLAIAAPDSYRLDPVHTRVLFAVEHAGFSHALGTVSGSEGVLVFDPDDWRTARLEVSVPIQRLDLASAFPRRGLSRPGSNRSIRTTPTSSASSPYAA